LRVGFLVGKLVSDAVAVADLILADPGVSGAAP
jgi:hypothetical protein